MKDKKRKMYKHGGRHKAGMGGAQRSMYKHGGVAHGEAMPKAKPC
tara:strand:+ start:98 stop:232 length:135 start_codon:yes stop_codon:yes gene_type:complete